MHWRNATPHFLDLVDRFSDLPGVDAWATDEASGQMEVPANCAALTEFSNILLVGSQEARTPVLGAEKLTDTSRTPAVQLWTPNRPLYEHQTEAAQWLVHQRGGLLADEMGLGKTAAAIVAAETLRERERPGASTLIIAPRYTKVSWRNELLAMGAIASEDEFCAVEGTDINSDVFDPTANYWFCHYEILNAWATRFVTNPRGRPITAILDEAHWVKNGRTKRAKGALAAAGVSSFRILLTGTPMANRTSELWNLLQLVTGKRAWGSPLEFRQRYCGAVRGAYGWQDVAPTNTGELRERMESVYLRREKSDAGIKLPPLGRQAIYARASQADYKRHAKLVAQLGDLRSVLDSGAYGQDTLRVLTKLRALTSKAKRRTTLECIRSIIDQGESAVVFTWTRETAEILWTAFQDPRERGYGYVVHGGMPQELREEYVDTFQKGLAGPSVLFATMDSLKEGVTLHNANHVLIHDISWVPADVLQAEARVHRIGQTKGCTSTWVLLEDSFDELVAALVIRKAQEMSSVLDIEGASSAAEELGLASFAEVSLEEEAERLMTVWRGLA